MLEFGKLIHLFKLDLKNFNLIFFSLNWIGKKLRFEITFV